jgi:hypothetical protein
MILNQTSQGCTAGWDNVLVVCVADVGCLSSCDFILTKTVNKSGEDKERWWRGDAHLYKVTIHFITVEVSIVGVAIGIIHTQSLLSNVLQDTSFVSHDAGLVQCGLTIHQKHIPTDEVAIDFDSRIRE